MKSRVQRNFLGCRALILCSVGRDRSVLTQQLQRLGIESISAGTTTDEVSPVHMVFFDADVGRQIPRIDEVIEKAGGPALALLGSDTPSSVEWILAQGACGYLTKPLRTTGILASLIIAHHTFDERRNNAAKIAELRRRLKARQVVCAAVVRLMRLYRLNENEAFRMMRDSSMQRRLAIEDLAAMMVSGELPPSAIVADAPAATGRAG